MTILGPDIANVNGQVDIGRVAAEGYQFVFAKVSEGSTFKDALWARTRDWCAQLGLLCVGYHYVRVGDPAGQASNFADNGGGNIAMFDVEANSGDINNYWAVADAFARRGIRVAITYWPAWYWSQVGRPDLSGLPGLLTASNYRAYGDDVAYIDNLGYHGWAAYGGRTPDLWQYTDSQIIAGQSLDCNAFRGTREDLAAALGLGALLIPDLPGILLP